MAAADRPKAVPTTFKMSHAGLEATIQRTDSGAWQVSLPIPSGASGLVLDSLVSFITTTQERAEERAVAVMEQMAGFAKEATDLSERIRDAIKWQKDTTH